MLSALAHSMLRDHVRLLITFVFCSNTCVSLNITKTSPQHHATLSAFHAFAVHDLYSLSIARTCTIARMSPFSGQCERLSRRLVITLFADGTLVLVFDFSAQLGDNLCQWRNSYKFYPVRAGGTQAIGRPGGHPELSCPAALFI